MKHPPHISQKSKLVKTEEKYQNFSAVFTEGFKWNFPVMYPNTDEARREIMKEETGEKTRIFTELTT